jgi:hypothetical protein
MAVLGAEKVVRMQACSVRAMSRSDRAQVYLRSCIRAHLRICVAVKP